DILNEIIDERITSKANGHFANAETLVSHYILDSVGGMRFLLTYHLLTILSVNMLIQHFKLIIVFNSENLFGQQFNSSKQGMPKLLQIMVFYMHNYFEYIVLQP